MRAALGLAKGAIMGVTLVVAVPSNAGAQEPQPSPVPQGARLVTSDVERFWEIYDLASEEELAELLKTEYLEAGTGALRDFIPARILGPDSLAAQVIREHARYEAARKRSLAVTELERAIRAPWYALEHLYPYAAFPDVYFVIGRFNSGGTVSRRGAIIGAEMLPEPEHLPTLVVHELVHFQQPPHPRGDFRLLTQVIREGVADFIAELASGRPPSAPYMAYGYAHEAELWREISQVLDGDSTAGWLYGGQPEGRPADLGYFFGYRIAEAYYDAVEDKRKAVSELINVTDYDELLRRSGYDPTGPERGGSGTRQSTARESPPLERRHR